MKNLLNPDSLYFALLTGPAITITILHYAKKLLKKTKTKKRV